MRPGRRSWQNNHLSHSGLSDLFYLLSSVEVRLRVHFRSASLLTLFGHAQFSLRLLDSSSSEIRYIQSAFMLASRLRHEPRAHASRLPCLPVTPAILLAK